MHAVVTGSFLWWLQVLPSGLQPACGALSDSNLQGGGPHVLPADEAEGKWPSPAHDWKEEEGTRDEEDGCVGCGNADFVLEFGERFGFIAIVLVSNN